MHEPVRKRGLKAEQDALRAQMRAAGLSFGQIVGEFARRYGLRPRAAWRHAYGYSLTEAARRIRGLADETGQGANGTANAMTGPHLCEHERWPGSGPSVAGRKPTPVVLSLLARLYATTIRSLLDFYDYEAFAAGDRLVIGRLITAEPEGDLSGWTPVPGAEPRPSSGS
jgi:hypothetical protein